MTRAAIASTQNVLLDNRNLGGANWTALNSTVTAGQADPVGGTAAALLAETAAATLHTLYNSGSLGAFPQNSYVTSSVCMRQGTQRYGGIYIDGSGTMQLIALWDLQTQSSTRLVDLAGNAQQLLALPPENLGGGWYRYAFRAFWPLAPLLCYHQNAISNDGVNIAFAGNAANNIYVFAPARAHANWAGPLTNTNGGVAAGPIRGVVPKSQNLWTQSSSLANAAWPKSNVSIADNVDPPPGYVGSASTVTETANGLNSYLVQRNTPTLAQPLPGRFAFSCFMKRGARRWALFGCSSVAFQWFDLLNGALGSTSVATGGSLESSIQAVGSSWFRCTASMATLLGPTAYVFQWFLADADAAATYVGSNGTIGGYWYGPQWSFTPRGFVPYVATTTVAYDVGTPRVTPIP